SGQGIDLIDHAVNLEGKLKSSTAYVFIIRKQRIGAFDPLAKIIDWHSQARKPIEHVRMGVLGHISVTSLLAEQFHPAIASQADFAPTISEKSQRTRCRDTRVKLTQAACCGVTWIDKYLFAALLLLLIQAFEVSAGH